MLPIDSLPPSLKTDPRLIWIDRYLPYLLVAAMVMFLLLVPFKIWETNDDIAMAMISQGYGIAAHASPGVVFSNVIWGWILEHLPAIGGIESYTLATYALLVGAAAVIAFSMHRLEASSWMTGCILLLMLTHTLLIPQFTVVAGYLAVAGLAVAWVWKDRDAAWPLCLAGLLLVLAGLVRAMELLFVLGVAWPFFVPPSWAAFKGRPTRRLAILALCVATALGVSHRVDERFYAAPDWTAFHQLNSARIPYTDYRVGAYVGRHPDVMAGSSLTMNDIQLLSFWFYQEPKVFDSDKIAALTARVPWSDRIQVNRGHYLAPLANFRHEQFWKMFCLFLILLLVGLRRNTRALSAFTLLLLGMFALYLMGRVVETRVYIAPLGAILVLLLAGMPAAASTRVRMLGICSLGIAVVFALSSGLGQAPDPQLERDFCSVADHRPLVTWGTLGTPIPVLYRPGFHARPACDPALYSLGTMQLAPYELENLRRYTGTDSLAQALMNGQGLYLAATDDRVRMLETYMREHHSRALSISRVFDEPRLNMLLVRDGGVAQPGRPAPAAAPGDDGGNTDQVQDTPAP